MNEIAKAIVASLLGVLLIACRPSDPPAVQAKRELPGPASKEGYAAISAEGVREASITTATAAPGRIRDLLSVYGAVQADAQRQRNIVARYPGIVTGVQVAVGDAVKAGQLLARVEASDTLETYSITAPIAGTVTARNVSPGEVAADAPLFVITDLSSVWVELSLFPRDLPRVRIGQSVTLKSIDNAVSATGRISWISAMGSTASQSVTARVQLANPNHEWTPGLYVTGDVILSEVPAAVAISAEAIQTVMGQTVVFVPASGGFEARPVEPGRSDGKTTELLSGLPAGATYVAQNSFIVKAEMEKNDGEDDDH